MEHRLGRTLRVFLVVLSAAGFYRLAVVPWVEPRIHDVGASLEPTPEEAALIRSRANRRLAVLGDVFPAGSWEREDPIVLESRQMRLLFKQYHSLPDGRVNLVPCTLVILPDHNRTPDSQSAGRTIVLRAPQGAVLEFDEPLDLRQGRLAKLIGGSLRGQVTIRGTPSAEGADDDIEIATRDVELEALEIRTDEMVQFRYGRSSGSGRAMVAQLLPRAGPADQGPNIGGVDSIRLDRDVRMRLEGFAGSLLPGQEPVPPQAASPADSTGSLAPAEAPVLVSCRGSLCMNMAANMITFEDHVDVVRTVPGGSTDQIACELLSILLGRVEGPAAASAVGGDVRGGLKPLEIQAKGTPVVARSSGAGMEARGTRLGYEIATRRILLDGDGPVSLIVQGTEMEARSIDYCPGPPGDPGSLMAVGPGWLKNKSAGSPPLEARWQKWLRMRPDGNGHVASLAGAAEITIESQGRLSASEVHLWLDIAPESETIPSPQTVGPNLSGVKPSRMLARGMVEIDVEQLTARTDRMELWFRHPVAPTAVAVGAPASPASPSALPGVAAPPPEKSAPPKPATEKQALPTRGRFVATGALVRGMVSMSPHNNQLEEISLEGQVHLLEESRATVSQTPMQPGTTVPVADKPAEASLEIHGDQLQLTRATRFDARAIVSGKPAKVKARGIDLEGPLVEFDRGRNRLTVEGAGRLSLPIANGMNGLESLGGAGLGSSPSARAPVQNAGGPPGTLDVTWQGRMDFDGLTARFIDRVVTTSGATTLRAGSLDAIFSQQIAFSAEGMQRGNQRADIARIACGAGVRIQSESIGEDGSKSAENLFVRDLLFDRATGGVSGSGPGRLTSTRFGQSPGLSMPAGPQGATTQPAAPTPRPDELTYLGVDFQRGMRGNINQRTMEFHQRVEAIWGPVAGWGDTLDPHAPGGLPPRAIGITSDGLGVAQTPKAPGHRRSSMELIAVGNVLVEGDSFTARSARLSWSEAKDLLVFEGDGRSDAQLFRQVKLGAPTSSASAGKILYWRTLNQVEVNDARYLDFDQFGASMPGKGATAPPPANVRATRHGQPRSANAPEDPR